MFKIVISGVNLTDSGKLSVLHDCLNALIKIRLKKELAITVLVHKAELVNDFKDVVNIQQYPQVKSSWLKRIRFEYIYSKQLSLRLKPDLWIGLHDMSANVVCPYKVVYCHNPSPFYKIDFNNFFTDIKFSLFCLFYKYLYSINIKSNSFVIVQQNWLRKNFEKIYKVKTIVAYPIPEKPDGTDTPANLGDLDIDFTMTTFFFPAFPRVYKNYEVIFNAVKELLGTDYNFQLIVTMNGVENNYARQIYTGYKHLPQIKFIGLQQRRVINALYERVNCLIFPSKLETWGLPLSEFKEYNKPMLVADLPYAHESVGDYNKARFFPVDDHVKLASLMKQFMDNKIAYDINKAVLPESPFFSDWDGLIDFLTERKNY